MLFYVEILLLILVLLFLYESSNTIKYYIKFLIYYSGVILCSILAIPYFILRPCNVLNLLIASKLCRNISWILGLKWIIRGTEHLNKDESCIIVSNHQSSLDVLGLFELWPIMKKTTVVAKRELLYVFPFSLAAWLCGLVFIDRRVPDKAKLKMNQSMEKLKVDNIKLWVFPEGRRNCTGSLSEFKKGAFNVAIHSQLPIVPVVFSSFKSFLDDKKHIFNTGEIIIKALPEISTKGLTNDDIPELINRTFCTMAETLSEITKEIENKHQKVTSEIKKSNMTTKLVEVLKAN